MRRKTWRTRCNSKTIKIPASPLFIGSAALALEVDTAELQQFSEDYLNGDTLISKAELTAHTKTYLSQSRHMAMAFCNCETRRLE